MAAPPTGQRSTVDPWTQGLPGWQALASRAIIEEDVPELQWPNSLRTYRKMMTNSQVSALRHAVRLPLGQMEIYVDPLDADAGVAGDLATDLAVPLGDEEAPPARRRGFSMRRHVVRALDGLDFGSAVFETVGEIREGRWRLNDLAVVPGRTLQGWYVNPDGSLRAVKQYSPTDKGGTIELPADRLLVYSWGGESGDPRGESILRPLYAHYLCLDMLMRIDSLSHERNGMGIPVGTMGEDASTTARDEMERLLSQLAAGENSNIVAPFGSKVGLMGVSGSVSDKVASMKWHQEAMARAFLAMLLQLGQTDTGSRALGLSFDALLRMFHEAIMDWVCEALTVQVSEPYFDRNVEPGAPAAAVRWRERPASPAVEESSPLTIASPSEDGPEPTAPGAFASSLPDGRTVRRQLYEHEDAATFQAIANDLDSYGETLAGLLRSQRAAFSLELGNYLRGMGGVNHLSVADELAEFALGWARNDVNLDLLAATLSEGAQRGAAQVVSEAVRAGAGITLVTVDHDVYPEARDLVRRLALQGAETAATAIRTKLPATTTGAAAAGAAETAIGELSDAALTRSAAGATARALHAGRVMELAAAPVRQVYASELLDPNTCSSCAQRDGTVYPTLEAALLDYPSGGYRECEGLDNCRGTLVATYDTEQEVVS